MLASRASEMPGHGHTYEMKKPVSVGSDSKWCDFVLSALASQMYCAAQISSQQQAMYVHPDHYYCYVTKYTG